MPVIVGVLARNAGTGFVRLPNVTTMSPPWAEAELVRALRGAVPSAGWCAQRTCCAGTRPWPRRSVQDAFVAVHHGLGSRRGAGHATCARRWSTGAARGGGARCSTRPPGQRHEPGRAGRRRAVGRDRPARTSAERAAVVLRFYEDLARRRDRRRSSDAAPRPSAPPSTAPSARCARRSHDERPRAGHHDPRDASSATPQRSGPDAAGVGRRSPNGSSAAAPVALSTSADGSTATRRSVLLAAARGRWSSTLVGALLVTRDDDASIERRARDDGRRRRGRRSGSGSTRRRRRRCSRAASPIPTPLLARYVGDRASPRSPARR